MRRWGVQVTDPQMTAECLRRLFKEIDTEDLRDICCENEFIGRMRNVYHQVRRKLDCDVPLERLLAQALEDQYVKMIEGRPI